MPTLNTIQQLLTPWNGKDSFKEMAFNLANYLGWYPSDIVENKDNNSIATGHLFVESGLENTVVISFINSSYINPLQERKHQTNLLGLSYNNLIDYHLTVESDKISAFHNRLKLDNNIIYARETSDFQEFLNSDYFTKILDERNIRPNISALDDVLINSISYWKRFLFSELNGKISNEEISNFFNAIIFARALEDSKKSSQLNLAKTLQRHSLTEVTFSEVIKKSFKDLELEEWPEYVIDQNLFGQIDKVDSNIYQRIISDFYFVQDVPYQYDFSVISKHALSRIYEKYVSVLNVQETIELNLFNYISNPQEELNKTSGSYYTPQFIARFFCRFLEKCCPDILNTSKTILEPSVGSGIFLRTLLEAFIEKNNSSSEKIKRVFCDITGIDKNKTACDATNLSLTLLHLISTNELPKDKLNIINADTLAFFKDEKKLKYDIILSNPPFIKYNLLSSEEKELIKKSLGECAFNKLDLYLAFVKLAVDRLQKDGIALFVLPSTFLVTDSAKLVRERIRKECTIKCIVDLSGVEYKIFEDADVYPILFIFQKNKKETKAVITNIREYVGKALTDLLNGVEVLNPSYNIYSVPQTFFDIEKWYLLSPKETNLKIKLSSYSRLEDFCDIRTGFALGNKDAFVVPYNKIPQNEMKIYKPYLMDREMEQYITPNIVNNAVFYPYIDGRIITEEELKTLFPKTYKRLFSFYNELSNRGEVEKGRLEWWRPNRSRTPDFIFTTKIVTPHLVFMPKFSIDLRGEYAISRSPFIVIKEETVNSFNEKDIIFYILGLLNSSVCIWHILNHSPKYSHGYVMIEPKVLKDLPIPHYNIVERSVFIKFINLVKEHLICDDCKELLRLEREINEMALSFYELNEEDKNIILG